MYVLRFQTFSLRLLKIMFESSSLEHDVIIEYDRFRFSGKVFVFRIFSQLTSLILADVT